MSYPFTKPQSKYGHRRRFANPYPQQPTPWMVSKPLRGPAPRPQAGSDVFQAGIFSEGLPYATPDYIRAEDSDLSGDDLFSAGVSFGKGLKEKAENVISSGREAYDSGVDTYEAGKDFAKAASEQKFHVYTDWNLPSLQPRKGVAPTLVVPNAAFLQATTTQQQRQPDVEQPKENKLLKYGLLAGAVFLGYKLLKKRG